MNDNVSRYERGPRPDHCVIFRPVGVASMGEESASDTKSHTWDTVSKCCRAFQSNCICYSAPTAWVETVYPFMHLSQNSGCFINFRAFGTLPTPQIVPCFEQTTAYLLGATSMPAF